MCEGCTLSYRATYHHEGSGIMETLGKNAICAKLIPRIDAQRRRTKLLRGKKVIECSVLVTAHGCLPLLQRHYASLGWRVELVFGKNPQDPDFLVFVKLKASRQSKN